MWRCHSLALFEGCDEVEETGIVSGEFVIACCNTTELFDLNKEAFDQIAVVIDCGVKAAPSGRCSSTRHDGFCTSGSDGIDGALSVVSVVCQNMACLHAIQGRSTFLEDEAQSLPKCCRSVLVDPSMLTSIQLAT